MTTHKKSTVKLLLRYRVYKTHRYSGYSLVKYLCRHQRVLKFPIKYLNAKQLARMR